MNNRKFTRAKFNKKGMIIARGNEFEVDVQNISLKGALVSKEEQGLAEKDEIVEFKLPLAGHDIEITAKAEVAHIEDNFIGLKFVLIDADSLTHLRRVLEFNIANFEQIESELFFLLEDRE